jgi:hypothetical protein
MNKGLRSRLTQYGDEQFALFLRRGFLKAAGYIDASRRRLRLRFPDRHGRPRKPTSAAIMMTYPIIMAGPVPAIHVWLCPGEERRGCPRQARA